MDARTKTDSEMVADTAEQGLYLIENAHRMVAVREELMRAHRVRELSDNVNEHLSAALKATKQ